jgi:hypothetical protein
MTTGTGTLVAAILDADGVLAAQAIGAIIGVAAFTASAGATVVVERAIPIDVARRRRDAFVVFADLANIASGQTALDANGAVGRPAADCPRRAVVLADSADTRLTVAAVVVRLTAGGLGHALTVDADLAGATVNRVAAR